MGGKGSGTALVRYVDFTPEMKHGRPSRKSPNVKGKRGRQPREIEEQIIKPVVAHWNVKEKNRLAYAEKTIRNAERIYRLYESGMPNPLNIDEKKLQPEAIAAWKYIFSLREPDDMRAMRGTFKSPEEVLYLFECFCAYIRDHNYVQEFKRPDGDKGVLPIVPNQSNFARWLGISRMAVYHVMEKADESQLSHYKSTLSDLLSEGGMIGVYNNSMAIFSLKNLCDWADKYDDRPQKSNDTQQTLEEARALIQTLTGNLLGDGSDG